MVKSAGPAIGGNYAATGQDSKPGISGRFLCASAPWWASQRGVDVLTVSVKNLSERFPTSANRGNEWACVFFLPPNDTANCHDIYILK
ncbi:MAG: hypothetical protein ACUVRZ_12235, partial [Desulfobacca sp.]